MKLTSAIAIRLHTVALQWETMAATEVDLSILIFGRRSRIQLRDNWDLFSHVTVRADAKAITWPGIGADIPVEQLQRLPPGAMTNEHFRAACDDMGIGAEGIAAALGMSRRAVTDYRAGAPIPMHVAHAMRYLRLKMVSDVGILL